MSEGGCSCYLSLGANLGEREKTLRAALERLRQMPDTELAAVSAFYETEPWGVTDQPDFLNAAVHLRTKLTPLDLLHRIQEIERELGRVRKTHWGARTIDIDIISMEGMDINSEELTIPHPYWKERAFVLVPLCEIAAEAVIEKRTVREQLALCVDAGAVRKTAGSPVDFRLKLVACVDRNWGIGRAGRLLFHFPEDLGSFRRLTMGHTVILGRKTMEGLPGGKPLEGRRHLLLTRQKAFLPETGGDMVQCIAGIERLWEVLRPEEENFVIGGAEVYEELLPYCREAHVTFADADGEADSFLRDLDRQPEFRLRESRESRDPATGIRLEFRRYERLTGQE